MQSIDNSIFHFLFNLGQKIGADWLFIFFASYLPWLIVLVFLVLVFKEKNFRRMIYIFGISLLGIIISRGIITETIRYFFPRLRPFVALHLTPMFVDTASSFPSGHASFLFVIALATFLISKKWGWILSAASFVVVISRVIAGVHWFSDIVGGAIIAGAVFALLYYLLLPPRKILPSEDKQETLIPSA